MNASRKTKSNVFLDFVKGTVVFSNGLLFYPLHVKLDKLDGRPCTTYLHEIPNHDLDRYLD